MKITIADLHCHPTMKPYGRSFPDRIAGTDPLVKDCVYFRGSPPLLKKVLNRFFGITTFPQASITALEQGGVRLIFCSLYPFEKGFVRKSALPGDLVSLGVNLVAGIGVERIHSIQDPNNGYFTDLENEYAFLKALDGKVFEIDGQKIRYVLLIDYSHIDQSQDPEIYTVYIGVSFEGAHALYDRYADIDNTDQGVKEGLFKNLAKVKAWPHCPLFITFAHHFYNGLCGHAKSLTDFSVRLITNQKYMLGTGLNETGKALIRQMLSKQDGKRILIDIKHMSVEARKNYFSLLDQEYPNEKIPIIVSHGAVCGEDYAYNIFLNTDINFSNPELIRIGESNGLFGIQLDERRIASPHEIALFRRHLNGENLLNHAALLVWRQIEYIAVLLDINRLPAWNMQCLGSDNDGIVNPLDSIWTSADFDTLKTHLLIHAQAYVANPGYKMAQATNLISAAEIVDKFMSGNLLAFMKQHF